MEKLFIVAIVTLLIFIGCKGDEFSSLIKQNQIEKDINIETVIDVPVIQNEAVKEEVDTLSINENKIMYENENVIVYKNMTDTDYKEVIDSPYGDMNATIKWKISNYYSEDDYGEMTINNEVNRITTILKKDINNSIKWMNNNILLIDGRLLYNAENDEKIKLYSDNETSQLLDYSINSNIGQSVLLIKNGAYLNIIVIDIVQETEVSTYDFQIPNAVEMIKYEIAYIDDENIIFNGYDDKGYPGIIKLDLISGESEKYSNDLMVESEYFTADRHIIIFNDLTKLLVLNVSENNSVENAVPIMSDKWYLKEDGIVYIYDNKCYILTYDNNENIELFDLKELNIDSKKNDRILEFCTRHNNLGIFYQTDMNEGLEEDYADINGINYILEINN